MNDDKARTKYENPFAAVDKIVEDNNLDLGSAILILQKIQGTFGYVSMASLERVSQLTGIPASILYSIVTFYAQFRLEPVGENLIQVCHGTACHLAGAEKISEAVELECNAKAGHTSPLKPAVVVMDIEMPKLNGIDATRQIKEQCPDTAVLILTAYDYEQYIFSLLEAGASGYLLKDVSGQELLKAIYSVNCGESVLQPSVARKVMNRFCTIKRAGNDYVEPLTEREKEVLIQAAKGIKNKEIAKRLYVSVRTIEAHLAHIFLKLGVTSRTEAVLVSLQKRLIRLDQL